MKHHALPLTAALVAMVLPSLRADTINVTPADDLAAIAENAQDGDVLELSATTYTLTREFVIGNAVTIRGAGIDQTVIKQT